MLSSRRTLFVPFTLNHSTNTSLVPLPSRQCSFSRRTLLVPFTLNHSANTSLRPRNRQAKPPMECGNLFPLSGLQPPASTPVRASPISQLRSPISDTLCPRARNRNRLCISLCSLCFLLFILFFVFVLVSIVTQLRRQEPRKTRNTRKFGKDDDPGLPVGRLRFPPVALPPPARFRRRRSAPYGEVAGTLRRAVRRVGPASTQTRSLHPLQGRGFSSNHRGPNLRSSLRLRVLASLR